MKRLDEVEAQVELEDFMYLENLYNDEEEEDLFDDSDDYGQFESEFDFDTDEYEDEDADGSNY